MVNLGCMVMEKLSTNGSQQLLLQTRQKQETNISDFVTILAVIATNYLGRCKSYYNTISMPQQHLSLCNTNSEGLD